MKGRSKEGREEARKVEMTEKDWNQQAVQKQVALAEQRERQQIGERWTEHVGPGGRRTGNCGKNQVNRRGGETPRES